MTTAVTYAEVLEWGRRTYPDIERRVEDLGWAFSVGIQPAAHLDNPADLRSILVGAGPLLVVKSTRQVWQFGSAPELARLYEPTTEAEFNRVLRESRIPHRPVDEVPLP